MDTQLQETNKELCFDCGLCCNGALFRTMFTTDKEKSYFKEKDRFKSTYRLKRRLGYDVIQQTMVMHTTNRRVVNTYKKIISVKTMKLDPKHVKLISVESYVDTKMEKYHIKLH